MALFYYAVDNQQNKSSEPFNPVDKLLTCMK